MAQKFEPKKGEEHAFRFDATPTYLFRLRAPSYSEGAIIRQLSTRAYKEDPGRLHHSGDLCSRDLLKVTPEQAAERLNIHLYRHWDCGKRCNLMSWSSSLLYLLQYGMYRHTKDKEPPPLSLIILTMIDIRKFPKQTFLRDIDAINHYYRSEPGDGKPKTLKGWREGDYCFGENLTQGSLNISGKHCQVSMQQLANAVVTIRDSYFDRRPVDQIQVDTARLMAIKSMNERLAFPFAVMLFALQDQDPGDKDMHESLHLIFDENIDIDNITYDLESHRMKELGQFKAIMEFFRSNKQEILGTRDSIGDMVDATQRLSVSIGDH